MPRSGREARRRLQQAAIDLTLEHGFDAVTTAAIAQRAGVTERTFFRHFADKREVLFEGEDELAQSVTEAVAAAPLQGSPLHVLRTAFATVTPLLEGNRSVSVPLARAVAASPALRERHVAKGARIVASIAAQLTERGVDADEAALAAAVGWAVITAAVQRWIADPADGLHAEVERAFARLRAQVVTSGCAEVTSGRLPR